MTAEMSNKKLIILYLIIFQFALYLMLISINKNYDINNNRTLNDKKNKKTRLNFIHIPKTGGTFIELLGKKANINWSYYWFISNKNYWKQYTNKKYCSSWHLPPKYFNKTFNYYYNNNTKLFCIVRNPYKRILSEYFHYFWFWNGIHFKKLNNNQLNKKYCNINLLNKIILNWLNDRKGGHMHDCHLLPQYFYVYDDNNNKICDNIIQFDNFINEIDILFETFYGNNSLIYKILNENKKNKRMSKKICNNDSISIYNFSKEVIHMINYVYKKDFELFSFPIIK